MGKHIEEQPRGLSENAMLLKVNEIITKTNAHHDRIEALEAELETAKIDDPNAELKAAAAEAIKRIEAALDHFKIVQIQAFDRAWLNQK